MTDMRHVPGSMLLLAASLLSGCGASTVTRTIVVTATPQTRATASLPSATPTKQSGVVSPAAMTLTLGDVGASFIETAATSHSNAEVAATYHLSPSDLARRGRLTSYETQFTQQQASGILQVDDVVAAWKSPAGAQWDFQRVVSQILGSKPAPEGVQTVPAPNLGDARRAIAFHSPRQAANLIDYAFVFRRGPYRAYVQVVAVTGTVGDSDAMHLAQIVDRRIQSATA